MDGLRAAAERALEALEVAATPLARDRQEVLQARDALRAALAAEQPQPVAVVRVVSYGPENRYGYRYDPDDPATLIAPGEALAIVKWPPPPAAEPSEAEDAARYRYLRRDSALSQRPVVWMCNESAKADAALFDDALDEAIDAALAAAAKARQG